MLAVLTLMVLSQFEPNRPGAIVRPLPRPPPRACEVELVLKVRSGPSTIRLEGFLKNRTPRTQTVTMQRRCPNPPMVITGLPSGVEAFQTCAMGPCLTNDPLTVKLGPGQTVKLGEGQLPKAGTPCSKPFVGGPHSLSMSFEPVGEVPELCGGDPVAVRGFPEPRPIPEPKVPEPTRRPAAPSKKRCPDVACGGCPGGYAPSVDGCPSCECLEGPTLRRN